MTFSDAIADWLIAKGITHAFGIIGGGNNTLWCTIAQRKEISIIATHHEQAAAMAAAYYYRISRKMALTIVTTGAGSTNVLTGVMAAWMDSVPLFVISGNDKSSQYGVDGRGFGFQGYDSAEFARPCTKVAMRMLRSDEPARLLEICYKHALAPRQGPVWVDIPRDIQSHALA